MTLENFLNKRQSALNETDRKIEMFNLRRGEWETTKDADFDNKHLEKLNNIKKAFLSINYKDRIKLMAERFKY